MTAGRFALGSIALLSVPVQLGVGYWVSGKREKNAKQRYAEQSRQMAEREGLTYEFQQDLLRQRQDANRIITSLYRHTDQLEREDRSPMRLGSRRSAWTLTCVKPSPLG